MPGMSQNKVPMGKKKELHGGERGNDVYTSKCVANTTHLFTHTKRMAVALVNSSWE